MHHLHIFPFLTFLLLSASAANNHRYRRLLHQPFLPLDQPPVIFQSPFSAPTPQPKYPFSSPSPPAPPTQSPFFPGDYSPHPPPPSAPAAFGTFPANVSSLVLPSPSHTSHKTTKLVSLIALVSLFSILVCASLFLLLLCRHRRRRHQHDDQSLKADSLRLFPPNTPPSDTIPSADATKKPPPPLPRHTPSNTSSEFLYLGTLSSSRDANAPTGPTNFQSLGSPELLPLPPLPPQPSAESHYNTLHPRGGEEEDDGEEFFSPSGSTANNATPYRTRSSLPQSNNKNGNGFNKTGISSAFDCNSSLYSISPDNTPSVLLNSDSPRSVQTKSPDSSVVFPAPLPRFIPPPPARQPRAFSAHSPSSTEGDGTQDCSPRSSDFSCVGRTTPPPTAPRNGPPELVGPSRKVVNVEKGSLGKSESKSEEIMKPLHWDRAMVWDHLKSRSLDLNEERTKTLPTVNASTVNGKEGLTSKKSQENLVLDPKKSQDIAMLLRALNVTVGEVCVALVEGNVYALGTEFLESLLRMAPSKEEERKLIEFKEGQSPLKLGPAEVFLKAVLNVPFAFRRIDAMLCVAKFESEVGHLNRSFDTLESACKELKNSRMFLKLLETVLKTGSGMNTGTHRGDANAFKLDTLLKLANVKSADEKTILLHFVVQEIIKAEESQQSTLRIVSGLSGELANVKKAAAMDFKVLSNDLEKLSAGIGRIKEMLKLGHSKFSDRMREFLKKAEGDIGNMKAREGVTFSEVKRLIEYFHGDSGKEEAHPLRLFVVVRDFLSVLDCVCKEVGTMNEQSSSSDDESSSSF